VGPIGYKPRMRKMLRVSRRKRKKEDWFLVRGCCDAAAWGSLGSRSRIHQHKRNLETKPRLLPAGWSRVFVELRSAGNPCAKERLPQISARWHGLN